MANPECSRRAWQSHAAVLLAALAGFAVLYCTQALLPALQQRYALSLAEASTLLTLTLLGLALTAPFSSLLASRWPPRPLLLAGLLALAASSLALGLSESLRQLLWLRLLQGLLVPIVLSVLMASLPQLQSGLPGGRSLAASYVSGTVLGGVIGRALPAALLPWVQWPGAFAGLALLQLVLALLVWRLFPKHLPASMPAQPALVAPVCASSPAGLWATWRALWRPLRMLALAGFCLLFSQAAVFTFIVPRLTAAPLHWSAAELGTLYLLFLPSALLVHASPRLMRRAGVPRLLLFAWGLSWLGLGLSLSDDSRSLLPGLTLFALAVFVAQSGLAELVGRCSPTAARAAAGLYLCAYYLGGACGALLPAWAWSRWGWPGCLASVASVQLLLPLCGWLWRGHAVTVRESPLVGLDFSSQRGS